MTDEQRGDEVRLVRMTAEQAARIQLIHDHDWNDLTPDDETALLTLCEAFKRGITEEEAQMVLSDESPPPLLRHFDGTEAEWFAAWDAYDKAQSKLSRATFHLDSGGQTHE